MIDLPAIPESGADGIQEPMVFMFGEHKIRVLGTPEKPRFVAVDVCRALGMGIGNASASAQKVHNDHKGLSLIKTPGGPQKLLTFLEPGLWKLVLRSDKPEAVTFQNWICEEVIPSIRKTGHYSVQQLPATVVAAAPVVVDSHGFLVENLGALTNILAGVNNTLAILKDGQARSEQIVIAIDKKVETISGDVTNIKDRVSILEQNNRKIRAKIGERTKKEHVSVCQRCFSSKCPCCFMDHVIGRSGDVVGEFDHWNGREDTSPESTWLVCRSCNVRLHRDPSFKAEKTANFQTFQSARKRLFESNQTLLFVGAHP